jgi:PPK2 family polyphosphate:nucleotide phosphotransferase
MESYLIKPGQKLQLEKIDTSDHAAFSGDKKEGLKELEKLNDRLEALQELLYAEHRHKVLVILQAMDTGGKDGVIRHVFEGVNPQGVRVAGFKVPTAEELDHDYLWRAHKQVPGRGELVIFNRSYYEDVLVVRVHKLVPEAVWSKRFEQINQFERMMVEEGTTILKFFLHIDRDEQKKRLEARRDDPTKQWKFNPGDLKERHLWDGYLKAYAEAISQTSTTRAPWYVVPANRKWYRNLVIASILVDALKGLKMKYPKPDFDPAQTAIE